jgi:tRNA threonylcarbamoyl adenosine modification protein (Sua5/YciO/YrdC/YwlC family)
MSQYFKVHPINPQLRLMNRAAEIVRAGGLIVYPTDSTYAFGWHIGDKEALERVRRLRGIQRDHDFTLACRDLSDIATYARVENWAYRQLKALTPGPYTFVLRATHQLPKRLQDPKRRSIGIRIPDHTIAQALLAALGEPLMS